MRNRLLVPVVLGLLQSLTPHAVELSSVELQAQRTGTAFLECGRAFNAGHTGSSGPETRLQELARCTRGLYAPNMSARNRSRLDIALTLITGADVPVPCSWIAEAKTRFEGIPRIPATDHPLDLCFHFSLEDGGRKLGLITLVPGAPRPRLIRFIY